ncbi:MAG: DNA ligase D [Parvibaculum sp.]|uniref:DNA ligase D n=1 Tax=Parvibaculum sp. TaxID=2024848 RepID=UPI0025F915AA|nr:DNA ligase D [Parvibaculum sp.]MCE9648656.1 DNA ligase D [Parvibaculum sp.]
MARAKKDDLDLYRRKRRFADTPEPSGGQASKGRNIFVVQKHDATRLHYDFRLELDGVLKSWAVTRGPSLNPADKRLAVRTEDHPMNYADFEGIIPENNYGAGTVLLWDKGTWTPIGDPEQGLKRGKLEFSLAGERMKGNWVLVRMRGKEKEKRENWLLIKEKDKYSSDKRDLTGAFTTSVHSRRNLAEIEKNPRARTWRSQKAGQSKKSARERTPARKKTKKAAAPRFQTPQLATLVDEAPSDKGWLFEIKFDGYRALLSASGDKVRFFTRSGLDWTEKFESLVPATEALDLDGALIDGEIVALDKDGRSDFGRLQEALRDGRGALSYFAFDLLSLGGKDLRKLPLIERKEKLKALLGASRKGPIFYSDHVERDGAGMLASLCEKGFEGIIAKRADAAYRGGRGHSWLKVKCENDREMVIGGYRPSSRGRPFSSLLLGVYEGTKLRYAGRVGTGFDEADFGELTKKFRALETSQSPFDNEVPREVVREAVWLKPKLVAQIGIAEFTGDGIVRHARYLGLRGDKKAKEVKAEKTEPVAEVDPVMQTKKKTSGGKKQDAPDVVHGVTLSHPDKVLYAGQGITKRDLAVYLDLAWPYAKPFAQDRLMSLVRCPEGSGKKCFFQRHIGAGLQKDFKTMRVETKNEHEDYIYLHDEQALITAAQMGVLEFHIWGSKVADPEKPDRIVFDLDPAPDVAFGAVADAAMLMRDALDALGLKSFPLLSGGKGIHVVVPVRPQYTWPVVKQFSRALAEHFAESEPKRFIANMSKAKRKGLIFIDYLRNDRTSTAIMPYSPRARENAPVAWPIDWDELPRVSAASEVTIKDARARLEKGAVSWKAYGKTRQSLKKSALRALGVDEASLTRTK